MQNTGSTVVILLLTIISLSQTAMAYTVRRTTDTEQVVRWEQSRVPICLDDSLDLLGDPELVGDIIAEAFATWEGSGAFPASFELRECSSSDGQNNVSAISGPWPYPDHANAVTLITYDSMTGAIVDADIVFNADLRWSLADSPSGNAYDLLDTATHEVGHLVGLEHSENSQATMYELVSRGSIERRTLHGDDVFGVMAIYGTAAPLGRVASSGCSIAHTKGSGDHLYLLVLIYGLLTTVNRLRWRRSNF